MSLFRTRAERELLPLLTLVSHVDAQDGDEVFEWLLLEVPDEAGAFLRQTKGDPAADQAYNLLIRYVQSSLLYVQEAMDALERGVPIASSTIKQLADRYSRSQARSKFIFEQTTAGILTKRAEKFAERDVYSSLLLRIFDDLIDNQHLLNRCSECHIVFERGRAGQKMCSDRCRNRVGQRRFADKKKAAKKSFTKGEKLLIYSEDSAIMV